MREEKEDIQTEKKKVCGHRVVGTTMFSRVLEFTRFWKNTLLCNRIWGKMRICIYAKITLMDCP